MKAPEAVIAAALAQVHTRLDNMKRCPRMWGGPEALELQALSALEFRSMLARPVALAADHLEVRRVWIGFTQMIVGDFCNRPLWTLYDGREDDFHAAIGEFIDFALERLPLEAPDA